MLHPRLHPHILASYNVDGGAIHEPLLRIVNVNPQCHPCLVWPLPARPDYYAGFLVKSIEKLSKVTLVLGVCNLQTSVEAV